ncbi:MAG: type II toxin-antitoxin system VapC family toxin [Candidatus Lokiarchaeota archaeon]|nr:type II toxin-antitoxin system VapC family toxin [Candidatus Lokiarchaeota archaeon]
MTVLIDSNVIVGFLKGDEATIAMVERIASDLTPLFVSSITVYEIYLGIIANLYIKGGRPPVVPQLLSEYKHFLLKITILPFDREAAERAADIRAQSLGKGLSIKEKDCQIAGIALAHGVSSVLTRDKDDFQKIMDLTGLPFSSF